jgi:hypothetical protein
VQASAATADGKVSFLGGRFTTSHIGAGGIEIPAADVFPYLAEADLAKLDIEGAEWPILADPRFSALRLEVVVLEYHAEGAPSEDPREAAVLALRAAGFEIVGEHPKPACGTGVIWAMRST